MVSRSQWAAIQLGKRSCPATSSDGLIAVCHGGRRHNASICNASICVAELLFAEFVETTLKHALGDVSPVRQVFLWR
jgi:hypothetical protein